MRIVSALMLPLLAGASGAADPVSQLAGRYSHHFINGTVTGERYGSDDVAEIVPVDPTHAYVRFALSFFNGHTCSLAGVAAAQGDTLVYHDLGNINADGSQCRLHIRHVGGALRWDDEGGNCKSYCGARGSFGRSSLPWASRRRITYMARLKSSRDYRNAIIEWRTGKPAA